MKHGVQQGLLPVCLAALLIPRMGQAEDYTYKTNGGTITITKYRGPGGAVDVPSAINGLPVRKIGEGSFFDCTNLARVVVPDSVNTIGGLAFRGCTHLTRFTVPASVTTMVCPLLYCDSLRAIDVDPRNANYSSAEGVLFDKAQRTLIKYPENRGGNYIIPDSVHRIEPYAFYACANLTTVTIPSSVTQIGFEVFGRCAGLTAVNVENGNAAYCSVDGVLFNKAMTSLIKFPDARSGEYTIPNGVTVVDQGAFFGSTLRRVAIPDGVGNIKDDAFCHCGLLTEVNIPSSVTNIGAGAFNSDVRASGITIPAALKSIGHGAFTACQQLTSVMIPHGVTSIPDDAFRVCIGLTNVVISGSVTNIGNYAFAACGLKAIYFEGNAPSLGEAVFMRSDRTMVYYVPGTVGWGATFGGCQTAPWKLYASGMAQPANAPYSSPATRVQKR